MILIINMMSIEQAVELYWGNVKKIQYFEIFVLQKHTKVVTNDE